MTVPSPVLVEIFEDQYVTEGPVEINWIPDGISLTSLEKGVLSIHISVCTQSVCTPWP